MRRLLSVVAALMLCVSILAGCTPKPGEEKTVTLNLFTWEGMFPQEVLDEFKAVTGIAINYNNFDFDETMLAKLSTGKGGDYDLVIADDYIIETAIAEGLVQKLDLSQIPNFKNINPVYQGQFYDQDDEYTVPYGAGVQTIVYNPDVSDIEVTGYQDLWDPSFRQNVGIIANYRVINGMALKVLGESYNTNDLDVIESAGRKLLELAPNIRLIKDDNIQDDLLSGEIAAAVMYTSQVTSAKLADPELKVVFPTEGIGFGIMAGFIPSQAPQPEAAHKFLNFLLEPEISAKCFEWLGYYCTTEAADELIDPEFAEFLTLPSDFEGDMEMIQNISAEAEETHSKVWTEFKSATGS